MLHVILSISVLPPSIYYESMYDNFLFVFLFCVAIFMFVVVVNANIDIDVYALALCCMHACVLHYSLSFFRILFSLLIGTKQAKHCISDE